MNIVKATKKYEDWLRERIRIVEPDLLFKHEQMAVALFPFFRGTFYRWAQVWPEVCAELDRVPHILSVGDLHVENFGTWRDTDGRLVWGVNDFDEACLFPYTMDLVRLATSALLAAREEHLTMKPKESAEAILEGYVRGMEEGGVPFILGERHIWLREIAESKLRDPEVFWAKMDRLPTVKGEIPESAREAIEHLLPERGIPYRLARRRAGMGSLGRVRLVAIAEWKGGRIAREGKALTASALQWLHPDRVPAEILYQAILRRAVRCLDPYVQLRGHWIVRRLSPHCSRIELEALGTSRGECRLLEAMGRETANIHVGTEEKRKAILNDVRGRKANWLINAAEKMADVMEKDWRVWRERWQS
ncbi:MAG TPA: DUF2252 family protein [Terriglobales bacterium]|jgi:hypothetical protein|nr:DUF2252 family protein [Terriglobales bacterium]